MMRFKGKDKVKSWDQAIAKCSCNRKACVAVARNLAVIMHALFYVGDPAGISTDTPQRAHGKAGRLLGAHR